MSDIICIAGPDFVDHDPPVHDCDNFKGTPYWVGDAWKSRGSTQLRCPRCRRYYWTPCTKALKP